MSKSKSTATAVKKSCLPPEMEELVVLVRTKNDLLELSQQAKNLLLEADQMKLSIKQSGRECGQLLEETNGLEIGRIQLQEEGAGPADRRAIQSKVVSNKNTISVNVADCANALKELDALQERLKPLQEQSTKIYDFIQDSFLIGTFPEQQ